VGKTKVYDVLVKMKSAGYGIVPLKNTIPIANSFFEKSAFKSPSNRLLKEYSSVYNDFAVFPIKEKGTLVIDIDSRNVKGILGVPIKKLLAYAPNHSTKNGYHLFLKSSASQYYKNQYSDIAELFIEKHLVKLNITEILNKRKFAIIKLTHEQLSEIVNVIKTLASVSTTQMIDKKEKVKTKDRTEFCQYISELMQESDLSHVERLTIASLMIQLNYSDEEIVNVFRKCSDFNERVTKYHIRWLRAHDYKPYNCDNLMCPYQYECGCKNPLQYYYKKGEMYERR